MALDTKERVTPEGQATDDAFNTMMNHPDNDDLRENLNAIERNPDAAQQSDANENLMNYMMDPKNVSMADKPSGNKVRAWFGRNKWSVAGGGSAVILLGGLFSMTVPLKLQGILESVTGVGMGRIESYVERRTQKIIFQAVFHNTVEDRNLVKGGSLVERIAKTMASNKFEQRLAAKGLEFVKEGKTVKVKLTGANMEEAQKLLNKAFSNADDLEKALDGIPVTKKIMKTIVKEDLGVWGFLVRGKMTRWMMSYLGVKRFGTAKTDENATAAERAKTAAVDDVVDSLDGQTNAIDDMTEVMSAAESQSGDVASGSARSASTQSVRDALSEAADTARTTISESTSKAITKVVLELGTKLGLNISEAVATKIGSKAIPVYGWIVAGATAVVFAHWSYKNINNGNVARAIASPAAKLMGNIYAKWGGIATQGKLGTLDTDLYNYYTPFLDGVETSSLFNCMDTGWQADCDKTGEPAYKKLNETKPNALTSMMNSLSSNTLLNLGAEWYFGWDYSPNYLLSRLIYNLDDAIMGLAMDVILEQIQGYAQLAEFLAKAGFGEAKVQQFKDNIEGMLSGMAQFSLEMMLNVFGLNISMLTGGNQLFDILMNGSIYSGNRYGEMSLGLHEVTLETASTQTQEYLAEQREYEKSKGVLYALFSPEATNSVTTRLVNRTSVGGGTTGATSNVVASLFGLVRSTPSSLASIITNDAAAATYSSPEAIVGARAIGMTDQEVASPVNANLSSGEACATTDVGDNIAAWMGIDTTEYEDFNTCKIDIEIGESILCSIDDSIRETPQCNPDAGAVTTDTGSVSGSCPVDATITDYNMQDGYNNSTTATKIHTCGIKNWPTNFENSAGEKIVEVNSEIAQDTANMAAALKADSAANGNYDYTASIGFRTFQQQQCIYDYFKTGTRGCSAFSTQPSAAARPGYSNHQMGYSIDLETGYSCSSPTFKRYIQANKWLSANMKTYGFSRDVGCSDYGHFTHAK